MSEVDPFKSHKWMRHILFDSIMSIDAPKKEGGQKAKYEENNTNTAEKKFLQEALSTA